MTYLAKKPPLPPVDVDMICARLRGEETLQDIARTLRLQPERMQKAWLVAMRDGVPFREFAPRLGIAPDTWRGWEGGRPISSLGMAALLGHCRRRK